MGSFCCAFGCGFGSVGWLVTCFNSVGGATSVHCLLVLFVIYWLLLYGRFVMFVLC